MTPEERKAMIRDIIRMLQEMEQAGDEKPTPPASSSNAGT